MSGVSCSAADACTAVGYIDTGFIKPLAERWNRTTLAVEKTVNDNRLEVAAVSCATGTVCTAVGPTSQPGGTAIETWDGETWTVSQSPLDGDLTGVSCTGATTCAAVGVQRMPGAVVILPLVETR